MRFIVNLRTTSPVYSAAPGSNSISLDGTINPPQGGFPLVRCRRMAVMTHDLEGLPKKASLPIVPANTMRSMLRRSMLKFLIEPALIEKGNSLSIGAYAASYAGNQSGNPDGVPSGFDEIVTMRAHPFIGLFGGGPRMLQGRLSVDNLYPIHKDALRIIGADYATEAATQPLTEVVWTRRVDPITNLGDEQDIAVIKDGVKAANDWIGALLAETKASKGKAEKADSEEKSGRGLRAFNAHEVVIAGVDWHWEIEIDRPSKAQAGFILLALSNLNKLPLAGGHNKGYGNFTITSINMDGKKIWNKDFSDVAFEYLDAAADALNQLTSVDFETFAASAKA